MAEDKKEEKTTYTSEEVDQMKKDLEANYEKGFQKKLGEEKDLDKILDEVGKVADDKNRLIDLYEEDEKVAKIILDKYYDGQDIEAFKESIGYKVDYTDPKMIGKLAEQKAKQMLESQKIADAKVDFINRLQMEGDELAQFEEAFSERLELKSFKTGDLEKHLEKAYREVNDDYEMLNKLKTQGIIGKTLATGEGKSGGGKSKKETSFDKTRSEVKAFLDKYKTS